MKFIKKSDLYKNVSISIILDGEDLIFKTFKNKEVLMNGVIVFNNSAGFVYYKKQLFVGDWTGNLFISKNKGLYFEKILDGYSMGSLILGNTYIVITKITDFDKSYLFNLETQEIIKEIKKLDYWLNLDECINIDFERGNYLVTKENLDTHEIIWSYDLRDLDKFKYMGEEAYDSCLKIIGNTTNELWVATKANRLLVLDLYSGEMIHLFEFEPYGYYAPTARFASLVNDTIVMFHGSLTIIDCKTKAILTYKTPMDLGDDFSNFEVEDASQVQGDYVTFIATKKGSQYMKTMIGIFDYKNQKLAWLHEFPHDEKVSISYPPVIEGNRLYALSYGHVLHVFEKEENL